MDMTRVGAKYCVSCHGKIGNTVFKCIKTTRGKPVGSCRVRGLSNKWFNY